jgi:hypothetical protein
VRAQTWIQNIDGYEVVLSIAENDDGRPVNVTLQAGTIGSQLRAMGECLAKALSMLLAAGVPAEALGHALEHRAFAPAGLTGDPDTPSCSSVADLIASKLALYGPVVS